MFDRDGNHYDVDRRDYHVDGSSSIVSSIVSIVSGSFAMKKANNQIQQQVVMPAVPAVYFYNFCISWSQ